MKILLAGGAGYIGSHTAVALLRAGYQVVVLDNFDNSSPEAVKRVEELTQKSVGLYETDAADKAARLCDSFCWLKGSGRIGRAAPSVLSEQY